MRNTRMRFLTCILSLAAGLFATGALADGGYFEPPEVVGSDVGVAVEMVDQRAALWVNDDQTEMWIQDRYHTEAGSFGWIIPVPHVPAVECVERPVLDALEYETAPLFQANYWSCGDSSDNSSFFGCAESSMADGAGLGTGEENDAEASSGAVEVWATDANDCFEYSVISSPDGQAVIDWVAQVGLILPDGMAQVLESYSSRGFVFLVAEVFPDPGDTDGASNTTVRIRWNRMPGDPILYPMALTGATARVELDFRLFVIGDGPYLPKNYPTALVPPSDGEYDYTEARYEEAFQAAMRAGEGDGMVVQYVGPLAQRFGASCYESEYWSNRGSCPDQLERPDWLADLWVEPDGVWSELVQDDWMVTRLSKIFSPGEAWGDIELVPAIVPEVNPSFIIDYPCSVQQAAIATVGGSNPLVPFACALLPMALVAGFFLRRRGLAVLAAVFLGCWCALACDDDTPGSYPEGVDYPTQETCNGLDDDENGFVDDPWPALGDSCAVGIGACAVEGTWECSANGEGLVCAGEAADTADEICNGADDDCDGICDEGFDCCAGSYSPCELDGGLGIARCGFDCALQDCAPYEL